MKSFKIMQFKFLWVIPILFFSACSSPAATTQAITQALVATVAPTLAATMPAATKTATNTPAPFELTSPAFKEGETIPKQFACTGTNVSPELNWGDPPAGTQSLALIFHDPTLGGNGWTHWVVFNLPPNLHQIAEGSKPTDFSAPVVQGISSFGATGYRGPCTPTGSTHTYVFTLYALDTMLTLGEGADRKALLAVMEGHILATAVLKAQFER